MRRSPLSQLGARTAARDSDGLHSRHSPETDDTGVVPRPSACSMLRSPGFTRPPRSEYLQTEEPACSGASRDQPAVGSDESRIALPERAAPNEVTSERLYGVTTVEVG